MNSAYHRAFSGRPHSALILSALLFVAAPLSGAAADPASETPARDYRVEVQLSGQEDLRRLAESGLDVAGVNRRTMTATVIAGEQDLLKIGDLGFAVCSRQERTEALDMYKDPAEIEAAMDRAEALYPDLAKKVVLASDLFEGHRVLAMKITKDVAGENNRPAFVMDAQHHAREVMTPEIALDAVDYLTSRYATDSQVRRWVDNIVIWIVPSVNPDGAAYVFETDNWWRRNRHTGCPVDLNRNYPFNWAACGGSDDSCYGETYHGASPASEPEIQGMLALHGETRPTFGLSYHSYGEYILTPYGCNDPDEYSLIMSIAQSLNGILQDDTGATGNYATGPSWSTIYVVDGGSTDGQYALFGTYAFCIEVNCCDFQPDYTQWRDVTVQRQRTAWQFFLNKTLDSPQIRIRVTDAETGEPVQAFLSLDEVSLNQGEAVRITDRRGQFNWVTAPGNTYHVNTGAPGYCSRKDPVQVGAGPATLEIALQRSSAQIPSPLSPADHATGQALTTTLTWQDTGAPEYEVYLGTSNDPPLVATVTGTSFTTPALVPGETYRWKIGVADACGSVVGPVRSFSTHTYQITRVTKATGPFRLVVTGAGFTYESRVSVNGSVVPSTKYKSPEKILGKGGPALKKMAVKGSTVTIAVVDTFGGTSPPYSMIW